MLAQRGQEEKGHADLDLPNVVFELQGKCLLQSLRYLVFRLPVIVPPAIIDDGPERCHALGRMTHRKQD